ncbi:MAG TPA: peptidoglycan DD-metalloendopeptidase family protein [Gemmatimonadaceae bacterium]|nr:peptidoglycan DD-metalloendopeptidase family protein [Gemmatimonadaceae bacterium]
MAALPLRGQAGNAEARIRDQRAELDRVRRERDSLEQRLKQLDATSRDISAQVRNIEAQTELTMRAVNNYNRRLRALTEDVDSASSSLVRAEDELLLKQAALRRRLIDIYKRGPLYTFEALLSAQSFGELVTRYKYLRTIAQDDRARVKRMEELRKKVAGQRDLLVVFQNEMAISRDEQAQEQRRLQNLEDQLQRRLATNQTSAQRDRTRLQRLAADAARIDKILADLDAERRRAPANRATSPAPATSSLARNLGRLEWPVEGNLLYSFGRLVSPNGTTIRRDGIGIAAPTGTPVRAVADGTVVFAASTVSTYGNTVMIQHGNDVSMYASLGTMSVGVGEAVHAGQTIGTVGISDQDLGPRLHFEIRLNSRTAVDPLDYLKGKH